MANTIKNHFQGPRDGEPIICTVEYVDGEWLFTVPGEGTAAIRDSKQARVLVEMLMNSGCQMELDDIEDAATAGPTVACHESPPAVISEPCEETYAPEDGDLPLCLDPEEQWKSVRDSDFWIPVQGVETHHTGTVGDDRMLKEIDRRVARLKDGIAAALARGDMRTVTVLDEERVALRKARDWYINSMSGALRLLYTETVEKKAKRCRMWIVRGLQAMARGLPKAAARLSSAISRGTEFVYEEKQGWEWIVVVPCERIPNFRRAG